MASGAETPNIAALPAIARLGACESARGPDADRHAKPLIYLMTKGSTLGRLFTACLLPYGAVGPDLGGLLHMESLARFVVLRRAPVRRLRRGRMSTCPGSIPDRIRTPTPTGPRYGARYGR